MPQEFQVLRCCNCEKFQVSQVKKAKKWDCKVCGEKQSYIKVYFTGSAKECRPIVQEFNFIDGEKKVSQMLMKNSSDNSENYEDCTEQFPLEENAHKKFKREDVMDSTDHILDNIFITFKQEDSSPEPLQRTVIKNETIISNELNHNSCALANNSCSNTFIPSGSSLQMDENNDLVLKMFAVVKFLNSDEVEVVHRNWLSDDQDKCFWPPYKHIKLKQALSEGKHPSINWECHDVNVMGMYDSYKTALQICLKDQETSNLETKASDDDSEYDCSVRSPLPITIVAAESRSLFEMCASNDQESESCTQSLLSQCNGNVLNKSKSRSQSFLYQKKMEKTSRESNFPNRQNLQPRDDYESQCELDDPYSSLIFDKQSCLLKKQANMRSNITPSAMPSTSKTDEPTCMEKTLLKNILILQELVKDQNKLLVENNQYLQILCQKQQPQDRNFTFNLPLRTFDELEEIERNLLEESYFVQILKVFSFVGGSNLNAVVSNIMRSLITDDLASEYNWAGRGEKKEFKALRLKDVICYSVQRNSCTKHCELSEIEEAVKKWLKHAPARGKRQNVNVVKPL